MKKLFFCLVSSLVFISSANEPKVTIITSLFKADKYLKPFLDDITKQTIFNECELLLIDGASPGNEYAIVKPYLARHGNIHYIRLEEDPGLYGVWNYAVEMSKGKYIANLNVDDRLRYDCYEIFQEYLESHPEIDLVYAQYFFTPIANEVFDKHNGRFYVESYEFSKENMRVCLPSFFPMWRKSLVEKIGYFDPTFKIAGDWEFWLRAVEAGATFARIPWILGLYYYNPEGLSTEGSVKKQVLHMEERKKIYETYKHFWPEDSYDHMNKKADEMYLASRVNIRTGLRG